MIFIKIRSNVCNSGTFTIQFWNQTLQHLLLLLRADSFAAQTKKQKTNEIVF